MRTYLIVFFIVTIMAITMFILTKYGYIKESGVSWEKINRKYHYQIRIILEGQTMPIELSLYSNRYFTEFLEIIDRADIPTRQTNYKNYSKRIFSCLQADGVSENINLDYILTATMEVTDLEENLEL